MTTTTTTAQPSPWIEIFRAGDYRSQGKAQITRADLERVVRNYDPSFHEAPVTVGHPQDNLPAFGWVASLALDGDTLLAREKEVDPDFAELRKAGRYKKRSASFYRDATGAIAGLRHVGYLGALPPEVKGLKDVKFSDAGREFIQVDFAEEESVAEKSVADQVSEYFRGLFAKDAPSANFSEDKIQSIVSTAVQSAVAPLQAQIAEQKTKLESQAASFAERETKLAGSEVKAKALAAIAKLKAAGKWIPAFDAMGGEAIFSELASHTTVVSFGEGDSKKELTPLDAFTSFMEGLASIVPVGTRYAGQAADRATTVDYGEKADPNSVQLHELATKLAQDKSITYGEALTRVATEHPNLTKPGNASAGAV